MESLNHENKHPCNFLLLSYHGTEKFWWSHGGEMALWKYFKAEVKTPLLSLTGSLPKAQHLRME